MTNVKSLGFASQELLHDHAFMHSIVKQRWKALTYASEEVRSDKPVVLSAVKQHWMAIESAGPQLQHDRSFMIEAIQTNRDCIPHGVKQFNGDRDFWIALIRSFPDGVALFIDYYGEGPLLQSVDLMRELIKKDWRAFQISSEEIRADQSIQLIAVCQCWEAVKWARMVELPIMEECCRQEWSAIELFLDVNGPRQDGYLSDEERVALANSNPDIIRAKQLADDTVTVFAAVQQKGPVLKFASKRLQADRQTATAAIRQHWKALEFASERLRGDRPLVMETLKQCGLALQYATEKLRSDHAVVIEAVLRHRKALPFMSTKLHTDELFWTKVCRRFPDGWQMAAKFGMADLGLEAMT
jgi:hypothetical protein